MLGRLLAVAAMIEFASVAWVLAFRPFEVYVGPIPIRARNASKPFLVALVIGSLAVWLLKAFPTAPAKAVQARIATFIACSAVVISVGPLVLPIFLPDFIIGHDGGVHQTYTFFLNRALDQGQLPPRWVEGISPGLGQPLFNFYQVGFYYLVALIHHTGPSLSLALKMAIALVWVTGPLLMFLWLRPLGTLPATLGAAVLGWSPYLLLDAYVRTAYPELTAIAFAPGVLWSIDRILATGRPGFVCGLAVFTGLLLISHLPAALIIAPVAAIYLVAAALVYRRTWTRVAQATGGALLGAGLAAFYVVPALVELGEVQMSALTGNYFDYRLHFVRPTWWVDWSWAYGGSGADVPDHLSLQIGIVQWIVIGAALIVLAVPPLRRRAGPRQWPLVGWLTITATALFMMTVAAAGVWARIGPLAYIQFPWRILMVPSLTCAVLAATVLSIVPARTWQAAIVLGIVTTQWYVTDGYRQMARERERGVISIDLPAWPLTDNARRWAFREAGYDPVSVIHQEGIVAKPSGRWTVAGGAAAVSATTEADARLKLHVQAQAPVDLVINTPYFPGWRVALDAQSVAPAIQSPSGYMRVSVPAGTHDVEAVLGRSRVRATAEMVTLLSAAICLLIASIATRTEWLRRRHAATRAHDAGSGRSPAVSSCPESEIR
jgi:hypothetical protein